MIGKGLLRNAVSWRDISSLVAEACRKMPNLLELIQFWRDKKLKIISKCKFLIFPLPSLESHPAIALLQPPTPIIISSPFHTLLIPQSLLKATSHKLALTTDLNLSRTTPRQISISGPSMLRLSPKRRYFRCPLTISFLVVCVFGSFCKGMLMWLEYGGSLPVQQFWWRNLVRAIVLLQVVIFMYQSVHWIHGVDFLRVATYLMAASEVVVVAAAIAAFSFYGIRIRSSKFL